MLQILGGANILIWIFKVYLNYHDFYVELFLPHIFFCHKNSFYLLFPALSFPWLLWLVLHSIDTVILWDDLWIWVPLFIPKEVYSLRRSSSQKSFISCFFFFNNFFVDSTDTCHFLFFFFFFFFFFFNLFFFFFFFFTF